MDGVMVGGMEVSRLAQAYQVLGTVGWLVGQSVMVDGRRVWRKTVRSLQVDEGVDEGGHRPTRTRVDGVDGVDRGGHGRAQTHPDTDGHAGVGDGDGDRCGGSIAGATACLRWTCDEHSLPGV